MVSGCAWARTPWASVKVAGTRGIHINLDVCFVNPLPVSCSSAPVYNGSHAHIVVDTSPVFIRSGTMPVPLAPHVTLAPDEPSRLEAIARAPSTPQALDFRCQVILRT